MLNRVIRVWRYSWEQTRCLGAHSHRPSRSSIKDETYGLTLYWVTLYSTKCLFCFSGWRSPQWSSGLISLTSVAMVISEVELTTSADKTSRAIQAPIGAATLPTLSIYVRSLDLIGWTYYRTRCISSPYYYHAKAIFKCAVNSKTHWIVNLVCFCTLRCQINE